MLLFSVILITLLIFSVLLSGFLAVALGFSMYFNYNLSNTLFRIEDSIDDVITNLASSKEKILKVLGTPLFFDNVEIRSVVREIERSYDIIDRFSDMIVYGDSSDDEPNSETDLAQ